MAHSESLKLVLTFPTTVRQKYAKSEQIYSEIFEKFTLWAKSALMKESVLETLWVVLYMMKISVQNLAPKLKFDWKLEGF